MTYADLQNLDFSNAGAWPWPVKLVFVLLVAAGVGAAGYFLDIKNLQEELERERREEVRLREEFAAKQRVLANLDEYRAQLDEMRANLANMLRQLPTGTEMPDLLEDISNTGRTHGLAFELFRPQSEQPREFYAAKPISIRARGTYHQFGAFVSSIAALSRIVTLEGATLTGTAERDAARDEEELLIEATVQTYRYLDETSEDAASN